ncbi:MAG: hypothetical protein K0Q55_1313 [Verrucomicrobia bacterium]|jgi:hypothetical protein|nr:hypothetical protein [Verrucomicrobiota bacterium]
MPQGETSHLLEKKLDAEIEDQVNQTAQDTDATSEDEMKRFLAHAHPLAHPQGTQPIDPQPLPGFPQSVFHPPYQRVHDRKLASLCLPDEAEYPIRGAGL